MKTLGPLALLCLGVILAGLFGARNGDDYAAYRSAKASGAEAILPGPTERLQGWFAAGGVGWAGGLVLIVAGATLAGGGDGAVAVEFPVEVKKAIDEIDRLAALIAELPMDADHPETRDRIDALSFDVLTPVVDARGRYIARHGLGAFTEYFSPFSAGERQLARAWSAITDGHAVVARESLSNAQRSFQSALDAWTKAEAA